MAFALGVVVFALGIAISIALHEAGHLLTAKAFGMKVRRYFIGFGPRIFSFRRGETEYGLKAIPAGGFCDIAGMTVLDPIAPEDVPRAFFRQKTWKRVVVLSAGSAMHFLIGIVLIYILAVTSGLPTTDPVVSTVSDCVSAQDPVTKQLVPCTASDPAPAKAAGLQPGDRIVAVAGKDTPNAGDVSTALQNARGPVSFMVQNGDQQRTVTIDVAPVSRLGQDGKLATVGAVGITFPTANKYNALGAFPATVAYTGTMFGNVWEGIKKFPEKIPAVISAIGGQQDENRPVSVVGASIIGGDLVNQGLWQYFVLLLALLNFFVGVFNLLPLLPLDGGHIAINLYQKVRDSIRQRLGKVALPPVDYNKLLPVTFVVIVIFGGISLLTLTADIVNPIRY